jgi:hypothetical protein
MSDDSDESDELLDFCDHAKVQADGVETYSVNGRIHVTLFKFQKFNGKMRRVIVGTVEIPATAQQLWVLPNQGEDQAEARPKH